MTLELITGEEEGSDVWEVDTSNFENMAVPMETGLIIRRALELFGLVPVNSYIGEERPKE